MSSEIREHVWTLNSNIAELLMEAFMAKNLEAARYYAAELRRVGDIFFSDEIIIEATQAMEFYVGELVTRILAQRAEVYERARAVISESVMAVTDGNGQKTGDVNEDDLWLSATSVPVPFFQPVENTGGKQRPKSAQSAVSRGEVGTLSIFYKKTFEVMFGLNDDRPPGSVKELARRAWPEEIEARVNKGEQRLIEDRLITRVRQALDACVKRFRLVIGGEAKAPESDKDFYEKLFTRYPDLTVEKLDELIAPFLPGAQRPVIIPALTPPDPARLDSANGSDKTDNNNGAPNFPKTEWLQLLYLAFFFKEDAPTLNPDVIASRGGLSNKTVPGMLHGALEALEENWDNAQADSEVKGFVGAMKRKWPGKNLDQIVEELASITL